MYVGGHSKLREKRCTIPRRERPSNKTQRAAVVEPREEVGPRFYKLFVNPPVQTQELRLPLRFAKEYGEFLKNKVTLKVPDSTIWKVELRSDDNDYLWLQKGWKQFVEYYGLTYGHFLMFTFEGDSEFIVNIFDKSCCEIEYDHLPKKKAKDKTQTPMDDNSVNGDYETESEKRTMKEICGPHAEGIPMHEFEDADDRGCFTIILGKSYVSNYYLAAVPACGRTDYLTNFRKGEKKLIFLYVRGNKTGTAVRCYYNKKKYQVRLRLHKFVHANNLKEGDACLFRLMEGSHDSYRVSIERVNY